jgi:hypothetical protein
MVRHMISGEYLYVRRALLNRFRIVYANAYDNEIRNVRFAVLAENV